MDRNKQSLHVKLRKAKCTLTASKKGTAKRKKLRTRIRKLEAELNDLTKKNPPPTTPMPKSYIAERQAKIDAAHEVSGYSEIRFSVVQGGRVSGK